MEKSSSYSVVNPHKMKKCKRCTKDICCDACDKLVNQTKKFSANLNEIKRKAPNEFGHMLSWHETTNVQQL